MFGGASTNTRIARVVPEIRWRACLHTVICTRVCICNDAIIRTAIERACTVEQIIAWLARYTHGEAGARGTLQGTMSTDVDDRVVEIKSGAAQNASVVGRVAAIGVWALHDAHITIF